MHTATLQELLEKDVDYQWGTTYQKAFEHVKSLVSIDTTLQYYDFYKPVIFQVDDFKYGLGSTLLQNRKSMAFASKALTPVEQHYAKMEQELLGLKLIASTHMC